MQITIDIPDTHINGALENPHSKYWAVEARWDPQTHEGHVVEGYVTARDGSVKHVTHTLNATRLKTALGLMATKSPRAFAMLLSGDYDGPTGDLLLQFMAFGELKYG